MRQTGVAFGLMLQFLSIESIALCSVASLLLINVESAIVLFIFDFLFISLAFQLTRTLLAKFCLLALGNLFGLFCNFVFYLINIVGLEYFGGVFRIFYAILFPILSVSWIVTFWSLSLSVLPKSGDFDAGIKHDD